MTNDLVVWLREKIAESLRIAAEACDNDLTRSSWRSEHPNTDRVEARVMQRQFLVAPDVTDATARHITLNDPDAVLAQCDAHTAILELHEHRRPFPVHAPDEIGCAVCHVSEIDGDINTSPNGWCATVRALALTYQNRGGYRAEWKL